ncbi:hypothetical protein J6S88_05195 [bacterium]|nr:hypothetical protein [bacterium]
MNISTNYQSKFNYGVRNNKVKAEPDFGNKLITKGAQKFIPAVSVPAVILLAMYTGNANKKSVEVQTIYGPVKYIPGNGGTTKSRLIVSRPNGSTKDIFVDIPQEILESVVSNYIHQVKCSTINREVGVVITQNQSKPVLARKIVTDGTLESCMKENNFNNISIKYDVKNKVLYADTPWNPGRQMITGKCLQVTYGTVKESSGARPEYIAEYANPKTGEAPDVGTLAAQKATEDRSFMPADIAGKQYEIVLESGERIPCDYDSMVAGVEYMISKKAGVELKMAVPPTDVISSEGELLKAGKLYMVDSNGHFYNGQPIKRIMSGEVTWNYDKNDPVQVQIRKYIDEAIKLGAESAAAKDAGNEELSEQLRQKSKEVAAIAEKEMTKWVESVQNKNNVNFFAE